MLKDTALYLESKFENFATVFRLLLDLTAKCTEMQMQFRTIENSNQTAKKAAERLGKANPAQLQDCTQVYRNCNRELARMAASFEKARYFNYKELVATAEKSFAYAATE